MCVCVRIDIVCIYIQREREILLQWDSTDSTMRIYPYCILHIQYIIINIMIPLKSTNIPPPPQPQWHLLGLQQVCQVVDLEDFTVRRKGETTDYMVNNYNQHPKGS